MTGACVVSRELLAHCSQQMARTRHSGEATPQKRSWGWSLVTNQTLQQTKVWQGPHRHMLALAHIISSLLCRLTLTAIEGSW